MFAIKHEEVLKHAKEGRKGLKNRKVNKVCHRPFYRLAVRTNIMPNDITNEADILDPWAEEVLERM